MVRHGSRLRSSLKKALAFNCKDRPNRFGGHGVCALFAWWTIIVSWSFARLQACLRNFQLGSRAEVLILTGFGSVLSDRATARASGMSAVLPIASKPLHRSET